MNDTFSLPRFGKLLKYDIQKMFSKYGFSMLLSVAIPTIGGWIVMLAINLTRTIPATVDAGARFIFINFLATLFWLMAPSRIYKECNLPNKGIYFAMLPSSKTEKFWSMTIICSIIVPFIIWVSGFLVDTLLALLPFGPWDGFLWNCYEPDLERIDPLSGPMKWSINILVLALNFLTIYIFMFTNTLFKKHKFSKTITALVSIAFAITIATIIIFTQTNLGDFLDTYVSSNWQDIDVEASINRTSWCFTAIILALDAALLGGTFYRLKNRKY